MRVKLWGVRGSLPSPLTPSEVEERVREVLRRTSRAGVKTAAEIERHLVGLAAAHFGGYGGNTPCIEVSSGKSQFIIDGGSGLRRLGSELMRGPCGKGQGEAHIFFTHFHWDHLIGLPFFEPIFVPGNVIHVYAVQPELKKAFQTVFQKPYFPVSLSKLGAKIVYHKLKPRKAIALNGFYITPYELDHPDPCWGYRVEREGRVFSHCVDTECKRFTRKQLGPDLPLYQNVDLMVFDAQYTLPETIEKIDWGHAAAPIGLNLAFRERIKRVIFMHHDPAADDRKVASGVRAVQQFHKAARKAAARAKEPFFDVQWAYAVEGMVIDV